METNHDAMTPRLFEIKSAARENYDTFTLKLAPREGDGILFSPGQFNMLYSFGVGEVPISISGPASDASTLVHTIRAVGTVTSAMSSLKAGDVIGVRGPFGAPWPIKDMEGHDIVVMAGGIGLAPLRPVIYHILANRAKYGKVVLLYGARSPEDILFRKEIEKWRGSLEMETILTVDRGVGGWKGNVGVVTTIIGKATFDPSHTAAFICGPEVMMRFSAMELLKRGVPATNVFVSMERSMKCGAGLCGFCQIGPVFVCKNGPVFPYPSVKEFFGTREV